MDNIVMEIIFVLILGILSLIVRMQKLETLYSLNEQRWVCLTLTELTFVFCGFTVFRAITLDLSSSNGEFMAKLIGLIFYQVIMNITFIII